MSEEEFVSRESGHLLVAESRAGTIMDRVGDALKEVAKWIIDAYDFYPSNEVMREVDEILSSGGVATVEISACNVGAVSLTIARAHSDGQMIPASSKASQSHEG